MEYKQKQKFYYDQTAKPRPQCGAEDSIRIQTPDGWKPATYVSTSLHSRHGRENPMILEKKDCNSGTHMHKKHVKTHRSLKSFQCLAFTFRGQIMHVVKVNSATKAWNTEYWLKVIL